MTTLNHFCVDEVRGFLPTVDPLGSLSSEYALWERVAADLPKLIVTDQLRSTINSLPPFPADCLQGEAEKECGAHQGTASDERTGADAIQE